MKRSTWLAAVVAALLGCSASEEEPLSSPAVLADEVFSDAECTVALAAAPAGAHPEFACSYVQAKGVYSIGEPYSGAVYMHVDSRCSAVQLAGVALFTVSGPYFGAQYAKIFAHCYPADPAGCMPPDGGQQ